jgi:2-dehydropantoate 2-reductase
MSEVSDNDYRLGGTQMKIGVVGTGAVGGYVGGLLARAGNDVTFLARGVHYTTMKEKGLTVEGGDDSFIVNGFFTDDSYDLADVDLAIICVKSIDTRETAEKLSTILKKDSLILTLQNGVDNEETLADVFGGYDRILSAAAYIQVMVKEPGVVRQLGNIPQFVIGALEHDLAEQAEKISTLFNSANIIASVTSKVLQIKWKKLFWNVTFNPLSALIESEVASILDNEGLYKTAQHICKEAIKVAQKAGIEVEDGFYRQILAQGQMARDHKTSMLQDKLRGKAMELESICGYIVKKGKELNVETPVLETIYHQLKFSEATRFYSFQKNR